MNIQEPIVTPLPAARPATHAPLKTGLIGVSGFGVYRRNRMRETGLFNLAVCYDIKADALARACEEEGARAACSVDDLLAEPGLEAVVISTGIDTHAPFAIKAMERGLHVFLEKPLCGLVEEARRLLEVRDATGIVFGTGHKDERSTAIDRLVRRWLEEGRLGTLVSYERNTSHSGGLEIRPGDWRGIADRNPGGMLIQCGVHALAAIQGLFGPVQSVAAMMRHDAHPGTETADAANVLLEHGSGLIGTLNCYHVTAYVHEFRLFGTKGNLYIETHEQRAWFQERRCQMTETRVEIPFADEDPLVHCQNLIHWYEAIRDPGKAPRPSLEDGIRAVLPVFAAERSYRERRTVSLSEFDLPWPDRAQPVVTAGAGAP